MLELMRVSEAKIQLSEPQILRKIEFPPHKLEFFIREVLELARARFKDYDGTY